MFLCILLNISLPKGAFNVILCLVKRCPAFQKYYMELFPQYNRRFPYD